MEIRIKLPPPKNLIATSLVIIAVCMLTLTTAVFADSDIHSRITKLASANYNSGAQDEYTKWVYPVGSIYMSINATDPATLFGGEWERIKDTFLLSAGDTYNAGSTGGEATHTLTTSEMPSHKHNSIQNPNGAWTDGQGMGVSSSYYAVGFRGGDSATKVVLTSATGGSQAHNNMPPYLTVYMWKRIS